jgi:hypothetical protein
MKTSLSTLFLAGLCLCGALSLPACHSADTPRLGSETHFLSLCTSDAHCGQDLACVCGACTSTCSQTAQCNDLALSATCELRSERPRPQTCADAEVQASCEVVCEDDMDCTELGSPSICDRGLCRQALPDCKAAEYRAEEYILLGDNFLAKSGQVAQELEQLMVSSGALSSTEHLRDYSSTIVAPFGGAEDLFSQYKLAQTDGGARVVILDAGGPDALLDCDLSAAELCPSLTNAKDGAESLLRLMQSDGVEQVILFFYPRPDEGNLADKFTRLSAELEQVCARSPVSCHFVPLAPLFEQERNTLLTEMGLFPTDEGALVTAGALFSVLREQCVLP